jgi:hypothetical protein
VLRRAVALGALLLAAAVPGATAGPLGPDVTLTVTPPDTATATTVRATVAAEDEAGQITCVSISWGDGGGQGVCMSGHGTGGSEVTYDFSHAYRRPGAWVVRAEVTSEGPNVEQRHGAAAAVVRVAPGADVSNGPALPAVFPAQFLPREATVVRPTWMPAPGTRTAGSPRRSSTGATARAAGRSSGRSGARTPCSPTRAAAARPSRRSNRYPRTGDRVVRVTAVSTGCDGAHRQSSTRAYRVQVPARF